MHILLIIVVGGILGWLASIIMRDYDQGPLINIVIGIAGAVIGEYLIAPLLGHPASITTGDFSLSSLVVSLLGAILLLAIVNLFQRNRRL